MVILAICHEWQHILIIHKLFGMFQDRFSRESKATPSMVLPYCLKLETHLLL